ncbi:hypothetical protein Dimus_001423, partial [Dionaea muscipula]
MEIGMSLGIEIVGLPDQWVRRRRQWVRHRRRVGSSAVAGSSSMAGCVVVDGDWLVDDGWVPLCRRWLGATVSPTVVVLRHRRWGASTVVVLRHRRWDESSVAAGVVDRLRVRKNRGWVELGLENGFNVASGGSSN